MVMPMGPDFARALGIPMSRLGVIGGSYMAAATIVGLLGSLVLDRFERRAALTTAVTGLGLATLSGALASGAGTLVAARAAAGSFGGIAATLCFSIVADLTPEERRGRATAFVASGFSLASILGVPAGLELARRGGWTAPFWIVGALTLVLAAACRLILPPVRAHLESREPAAPLRLDRKAALAFAALASTIFGNFLLVPNLSAFMQFNLGFPREKLGFLYLFGGLMGLATMRVAGVWMDRSGAFKPVLVGTILVTVALGGGAVLEPPLLPPLVFFTMFMSFNAGRWVTLNALSTLVPAPGARARFLSAQMALSHASSALASFASTAFLSADASGKLSGMRTLAATTVALGFAAPWFVYRLESLLPRRAASIPVVPPEL